MKKKFLSSAAGLALCMGMMTLSGGTAQAQQEMGSLYYYSVTDAEIRDNYHAWQVFLEYNLHREQCAHYQAPPAGFVMRGCNVYRVSTVAPVAVAAPAESVPAAEPLTTIVPQAGTSTSSYTIYFNFDKSNVRNSEKEKVESAVQDIQKYTPAEVTVSGYADRAGPEDYNQKLSEKRAAAVSEMLTLSGVKDAEIEKKAYGETHVAVPTADGVPLQANRRVVIEFNH